MCEKFSNDKLLTNKKYFFLLLDIYQTSWVHSIGSFKTTVVGVPVLGNTLFIYKKCSSSFHRVDSLGIYFDVVERGPMYLNVKISEDKILFILNDDYAYM